MCKNHVLTIMTAAVLILTPTIAAGSAPPAGGFILGTFTRETPPAQPAALSPSRALSDGLLQGIAAIAAGGEHTCALTTSGGVKCWGANGSGQLGDGTTANRSTPADVGELTSGVAAIAAGDHHTCALTASGGVKCWGWNGAGQLGDGTTTSRGTPVDVSGLTSGVTAITAGESHTCVRTASGGVKCWGRNDAGQLGDGTTTERHTPVEVNGLPNGVIAIAAGDFHTCALITSGGVRCWGANGSGQLGDGTTTQRSMPVDVSGLTSRVTAVAAGDFHTCALITSGGVRCWGANGSGQLGDGTTTQRSMPVDVSGLASGVTAIAAGGEHTCALTTSGGVKCWGSNSSGRLGDGTYTSRSTPMDVSGLTSGVTAITAGGNHTCALTASSGVKCWGGNWDGQLGDGTTTDRTTPMDVSELTSGVMAIAAGGSHTCALTIGGGVKCWGGNSFGQLGDGTTDDRSTAVDVSGLTSGVAAIAAGGNHTCALTASGGVKCWGDNSSGQLGDGTTDDWSTPVDVGGLTSGVTAIAAGWEQTCALTTSGGAKCWGLNNEGQLGDGTTTQRSMPVDVSGLTSGAIAIVTGGYHTCALITSSGAKCWGRNNEGELGDGTTTERHTPVDVGGLAAEATAIAAGSFHTCGLVGSGRPRCWGSDSSGQLGFGTALQRLTPIDVVTSVPPALLLNYTAGHSGSFFTLSGWNFPPNSTASLVVNGHTLTTTLAVNPTGGFTLFLDTAEADDGFYVVTAAVSPSASIRFTLDANEPSWIQEGGGLTFQVPAGIAYTRTVYLPLVQR
jgi:alpha-tubulin suppressor-like RCC1 family protein